MTEKGEFAVNRLSAEEVPNDVEKTPGSGGSATGHDPQIHPRSPCSPSLPTP
jgi:hypothetical protein